MKSRIRFLFIFVVIFYLLVFIGWIIANKKFINRKEYVSNEELFFEKHIKNDACTKTIYGEPLRAGNNLIRINFYCDKNRSSKNILSLNIFQNKNVASVIEEICRINNFKLEDNFKCYFEGKIINNFKQEVISGKTIDCLSPNIKISDIYKDEIK